MFKEESRRFRRHPCRGEVLVYRLEGGPPLKGMLADAGNGGVRVTLGHPLEEDEAVRLVFSRPHDPSSRPGRTIIGRVAHARRQSGCYHVGIAFAWEAAMADSPRIRPDAPTPRWLRFFSREARHRKRPTLSNR